MTPIQRQCNHCGKKTEQEVVCKLTTAGNDTYSWYCHTCGKTTGAEEWRAVDQAGGLGEGRD